MGFLQPLAPYPRHHPPCRPPAPSPSPSPTATLVDLIDGEPRRREHPHVRPELLGQRGYHIASRGRGGHADTLGAHLLARVLVVEPVRRETRDDGQSSVAV